MKFKDFLLDRGFLISTWLHGLGYIRSALTGLVLVVVLWLVSESFSAFFDILKSELGRIIRFCVALTLIFDGIVLAKLGAIKDYLSSPPTNSFKDFKEFRQEIKTLDKDFPELKYPLLISFLVFIGSGIWYFLSEDEWKKALLLSLGLALSLMIGIAVAHFSVIMIEVILLILRYIIQSIKFRVWKNF